MQMVRCPSVAVHSHSNLTECQAMSQPVCKRNLRCSLTSKNTAALRFTPSGPFFIFLTVVLRERAAWHFDIRNLVDNQWSRRRHWKARSGAFCPLGSALSSAASGSNYFVGAESV